MLKIENHAPEREFEYQGEAHTLDMSVFHPSTREKYASIIDEFSKIGNDEASIRTKYAKAHKKAKAKAAKGKVVSDFDARVAALEPEKKRINNKWKELMECLLPSSKGKGWFDPVSTLEDYANNTMVEFIGSRIMGMPFTGRRYTHETAERVMNALADEKAGRLSVSREEVLREVEKSFEKK